MNSYRATWKAKTGETGGTGSVIIEAESKGQAKRIFIQRNEEQGQLMTDIRELANNPRLSSLGTEILRILQESGYRFFISGLDILSAYMHHIPERFPVLLYGDRYSQEEIRGLLIKNRIVAGSYRDARILQLVEQMDGVRGIVFLYPTSRFTYALDGIATIEKAFVDIYYEVTRHDYPLSVQELARICSNMLRRKAIDAGRIIKVASSRRIPEEIRYFIEQKKEP